MKKGLMIAARLGDLLEKTAKNGTPVGVIPTRITAEEGHRYGSGLTALNIIPKIHDEAPVVAPSSADVKELLASVGVKTPREQLRDMSITRVDKLTPTQREEYQKHRDKFRDIADKRARDEEAIERALAHFRRFELTKEGIIATLKYISSMLPKHYDVDNKMQLHNFPTRYGLAQVMSIVIKDLKSGFSASHNIIVIDNKICIPSKYPRNIKRWFEFKLKQHLDYELRFKKRDQDHYSNLFTKRSSIDE